MLTSSALGAIMMKTVDIYPKRARRLNSEKEDENLDIYNSHTLMVHDEESEVGKKENIELSIDGEVQKQEHKQELAEDKKENEFDGLPTIGYDEKAEEPVENKENTEEGVSEVHEPQAHEIKPVQAVHETSKTPTSIEQAVKDAMAGKNGNTPVIVINTGNQATETHQQHHTYQHSKAIAPISNHPDMNNITISDIDTLVSTLDTVRDLYDAFYELLPSDDEDGEEKTTLETSVDVLRMYAKIRELVKKVYHDRHQLLQDLVFIHDKVHMIHTSENDMLSFYGLDVKYSEAKIKSSTYMAKDEKFSIYFKEINNYTLKFNDRVKEIGAAAADLFRLNEFFRQKIEKFDENNYEHIVINVLDKLDKVLMTLVELTELRTDIQNSISAIKNSFLELKELKFQIESDIANVERLVEFYALEEKNKAQAKVGKGNSIITVTLIAFALTFLL